MKNKYTTFSNLFRIKVLRLVLSLFVLAMVHSGGIHAQVTGSVFRDYNANGVKDNSSTFNEPGFGGVTITGYGADGTNYGPVTSATNGTYTLPGVNQPTRLEFTWTNPILFSGPAGNTSVVFVNGATTNINFGLNNPSHYSQALPTFAVPCYVFGEQVDVATGTNRDADVLVQFDNNAGSVNRNVYASVANPSPMHLASAKDIGTVWGLAWSPKHEALYASAYLKRHAGFGPGGPGAIYQIKGGVITTLANYGNAFGTDPHPAPSDQCTDVSDGSVGNAECWLYDIKPNAGNTNISALTSNSYNLVGKMSFGDIDINAFGDTLYAINMFSRSLYIIPIDNPSNPIIVPIPDPGCSGAGNTYRPFGIGVKDDEIYVGLVCQGSNYENADDLSAFVYRYKNGSFGATPVLNIDLSTFWEWKGWPIASDFTSLSDPEKHRQAMLSDIEFDERNDMIIAFRDRNSDIMGDEARPPLGNMGGTYSAINASYLLRACWNGSSWDAETNGSCGGITSGGDNFGDGPDGGEYYWGQNQFNNISSTGMKHKGTPYGGLAHIPGSPYLLISALNPVDNSNEVSDAGIRWLYNNSTTSTTFQGVSTIQAGSTYKGFLIFDGSDGELDLFDKAAGLGDLVSQTSAAPLEIGNYVWNDTDQDGVQDALEPALSGVKVALYKDVSGTLTYLANTTTGANGEYYFSGLGSPGENWTATSGFDSLNENTSYKVVFGWDGTMAQFAGGSLTISGMSFQLTDANSGEGTNPDLNDSDASLMTVASDSYPSISLTTGDVGSVNHTYDAGFFLGPDCEITVVSATPSACATTTNSYSLSVVVSYSNGPTGNIDITTSNGASISVAQTGSPQTIILPNLTSDGVQDIDVTASFAAQTGCTDTEPDIYDSPASCWLCAGNLLANPSFETGTLNTSPPSGWSGDGQIAGNNMNEPHGTQYGLATFPGINLYQDVPATPGSTFSLTFYSGAHNPSIQTVTLRYLDAGLSTLGTPSVHTVVYDTDVTTPQQLGGPYSLTLAAAPAGTAFVRVEANTNGVDFIKVDAFCLTATAALCDVIVASAVPTACVPATNQYTLNGTVTFTDAPMAGTLTVQITGGGSQVFNAPFTSPLNFSIASQYSDGAMHTVTATFSATPTCNHNITYTAPVSCLCTPPVLVTANGAVCTGYTMDLNSLVTGNTPSGNLSFYTTLADATAGTNALVNTTVAPIATSTYYARSAVSASCFSTASMTVTVVNNPNPTVSNGQVCAGGSLDLNTLVSDAGGGMLTFHATYANALAGTPVIPSTVSPTGATNYYVRSTVNSNGIDCIGIQKIVVSINSSGCIAPTVNGPN